MAATADDAPDGFDAAVVARRLSDADFVVVSAAATGDALAATGLLVRACREAGLPFQARVRPDPDRGHDDALTVRLGDDTDADVTVSGRRRPASVDAHAVAERLGDSSPVLALAGAKAAGVTPGAGRTDALLETAERRGLVARRPGLATPTADLADGLAHSTRLRVPESGDAEAARATLDELSLPAELDDAAHRRVASLVAVTAATAPDASSRAADTVGWLLRPYATPDGPFATLGGYADVLAAAAREAPGAGVALALGDTGGAALGAWRAHARGVHALLDGATTARYDGVFVARADDAAPKRLATAARLLRDCRSPEPVALVVADGAAAASAVEPAALRDRLAEALAAAGSGRAFGGPSRAGARVDGDPGDLVRAFREVTR